MKENCIQSGCMSELHITSFRRLWTEVGKRPSVGVYRRSSSRVKSASRREHVQILFQANFTIHFDEDYHLNAQAIALFVASVPQCADTAVHLGSRCQIASKNRDPLYRGEEPAHEPSRICEILRSCPCIRGGSSGNGQAYCRTEEGIPPVT